MLILRKGIVGCSSEVSGEGEVLQGKEIEPPKAVEESDDTDSEDQREESEEMSLFNTLENAEMVSINDEIFVSSGNYHHVNMTLIVSGNEGTIVDAGSDTPEGERVKRYIDQNYIEIKNIILTHRHSDHVKNIETFMRDGVAVYEFNNTEDGQIIEMGDKKFVIIHTSGHFYDKHLSVVVNDNILIAGDILTSNLDPLVVVSYGGNKERWINTLQRILEKDYKLVIPGHGPIVEGSKVNKLIVEHIEKLEQNVDGFRI